MNSEERKKAIKKIKKWMKVHGLKISDLGFDSNPKSINDLEDAEIDSVIEDVNEDDAREENDNLMASEAMEGDSDDVIQGMEFVSSEEEISEQRGSEHGC